MTCLNQNCAHENYPRRKILWQMYHLLAEMENQTHQPRRGFPFNFLEMGVAKVLLSFEHGALWLTDRALASPRMQKLQRKFK